MKEKQPKISQKESVQPKDLTVIVDDQVISREQFGQGKLGDQIWTNIKKGIGCETTLENGEMCKKPAIGTVDYDVIGELDSVYVCGEEHAKQVSTAILNDLHRIGRDSVLGRNGNGRVDHRISDIAK